jgi:hypothetical protein
VSKNVYLDMTEVDGTATFQYSQFSGDVSLQDARIGTLRGFTYVRIVGDWKELFGRLRHKDLQPYAQLEKVFRSFGGERDADEVYLARRDAERNNLRQSIVAKSPEERPLSLARLRAVLKWTEDSVLRWFFNYGVPSYRMFWLACAQFLISGLILSNWHALELVNKADAFCERTRCDSYMAPFRFLTHCFIVPKRRV